MENKEQKEKHFEPKVEIEGINIINLTEKDAECYFDYTNEVRHFIQEARKETLIEVEKMMDYLNDPFSERVAINKSDWNKFKQLS